MTDVEIWASKIEHAINRAWFSSIVRQGTPSRLSWPVDTATGRWCYDFGTGAIVFPRRKRKPA